MSHSQKQHKVGSLYLMHVYVQKIKKKHKTEKASKYTGYIEKQKNV